MKKKIAVCFLTAVLAAACLGGCGNKTKTEDSGRLPGNTIVPGTDKTIDQILAEAQQSEFELPKGEITEIWFEEELRAYYPKQLKDIVFTKMYMYGELQSTQPVICLCSEKLSELEIFAVSDGAAGDVLYTVDELLPMEAIVLQVELSENADIGIRFKNGNGENTSYALSRNADSSEVVMMEISAE